MPLILTILTAPRLAGGWRSSGKGPTRHNLLTRVPLLWYIMFEVGMEKSLCDRPSISVVLALPPTLNQSYTIVKVEGYSRLALTDEANDYKDEVAVLAFQAMDGEFPVENGPRAGEYRLELVLHLTANTRDVDANVKLVMDGICRGIGLNDNRVFKVTLEKRVSHKRYGKRWLEARLIYLGRGIHEVGV